MDGPSTRFAALRCALIPPPTAAGGMFAFATGVRVQAESAPEPEPEPFKLDDDASRVAPPRCTHSYSWSAFILLFDVLGTMHYL